MRKTFVTLMMLASCSFISAQIDSTMVEQSARMIGGKSEQTTPVEIQQPPAQTYTTQRYRKAQWFTIGAKIGYNITLSQDKISDLYTIHTGLRHGGSTGIYMRLGTNVFCQPELLYTFAIYDEERFIDGDKMARGMQTHTLDVPVLLGYSPICSETFKLRLMIGPRFAFNVNTSDKYKSIPIDNEDVAVSLNKGRLGLDCGIGFDFWRISLDLRYILMSDIFRYQYEDIESTGWKNVHFPISTFNISLGYNIWGNNMPSAKKQKYDPSAYDFFRRDRELKR